MEILPCLILTHISLMNNTFPHVRTNFILFSHIPSLPFSFPQLQRLPSPLVNLHDFSLSLFPLLNGSFEILPSNQWPLHPSKAKEIWEWFAFQLILGWEFLGPMRHKKNSILQSNRVTILMTNGIGGLILSLILDILMRFLNLILILSVHWPSHPTFSS